LDEASLMTVFEDVRNEWLIGGREKEVESSLCAVPPNSRCLSG